MANLIITIDGPAGSGKSTVARLVADRIAASFLDTGAMYRAVTLAAMQSGADMHEKKQLIEVMDSRRFVFEPADGKMNVFIDGRDVTEQIRGPIVTANSAHVAGSAEIREKLVAMQRQAAEKVQKIVTEGRDQGTVVFPEAQAKFYLTASKHARAHRRHAELVAKGGKDRFKSVLEDIIKRDQSDMRRKVGPLRAADDAIVIDTTEMSIEQVVDKIVELIEEKCQKK